VEFKGEKKKGTWGEKESKPRNRLLTMENKLRITGREVGGMS